MPLLSLLDRVSDAVGQVAGWIFFAIGLALTYDVCARFLFLSPTAWAGDVSTILQVWAVYLAMAHVLRTRSLIRITAFVRLGSPAMRKAADAFSILLIGVFSGLMAWYSLRIVIESIEQGRRAATMIETPTWVPEIAIPIGFILLLLQCLAELARVAARPAPAFDEEEV